MGTTNDKSTIWPVCFLYITWLTLSFCTAPVIAAGLEGDKQLLETAAAKYRENFDKLRTWKGTANYVHRSQGSSKKPDVTEAFPIQFALDIPNHREWFSFEQMRNIRDANTGERQRRMTLTSGVLIDGTYYHLHVFLSADRRRAHANVKRHTKPSWNAQGFDPTFFMKEDGVPWDKRWKRIAENFDDERLHGSVTQNGENVEYVRTHPGETLRIEQSIALDKGGNVIRISTTDKSADGTDQSFVTSLEWQNLSEVWIPLKVSKTQISGPNGAKQRYYEFEFQNVTVNEQLADDQFSLVKLGLRQGDLLSRPGNPVVETIKGPEFPPGPPRTRPVPMRPQNERQPQTPQ